MPGFEKVLIIDDDPTQLAILSAYFSSLRTREIMTAADGTEAVGIMGMAGDQLELIVCDLNMPNMDGLEFLRYLATISFNGGIVIISSLDASLLRNSENIGKMHGLNILGTIKKPMTKSGLDKVFSSGNIRENSSQSRISRGVTSLQISDGLKNGEFVPYYQPKMDLVSGKIVGAEALARWFTDSDHTIHPMEFIPAAEKFGMIESLTFELFQKISDDIKSYKSNWNDLKISINLPPTMISSISLPNKLKNFCRMNQLSCEQFCLEVTETGLTEFDADTIEVLSRLRIQGFELSIDDFGTGASNISNLRMFPYSEMKIDRSFIHNIERDAFSAETVRAGISLARQLDMRIVAEGIETREVLEILKAKGVDQAQGYLISKPLMAADLDQFLKNGPTQILGPKRVIGDGQMVA